MKKFYATLIACFGMLAMQAQPAGWSFVQPYQAVNNTATQVVGYQLRLDINTATLISNNQMLANGDDIRFGKECSGTTLLNYWIESGINTANTIIWVKLDTLYASDTVRFYMYYGNSSATPASAVFGTFIGPHSSTDSVASGGAGGVANSQRGFRFAPNEDVLMTHVGKRDPNGTVRTVTLFNFTTQAIITQQTVGGPAGQYSYNPLTAPIWLTQGTQYTLQLYQGTGDGYYFGTSSQIGQHLTYYDMRYCNSCTQNTFPTNVLSNYHYGYPDMWYFTKLTVAVPPTVSTATPIGGPLTTTTSGSTSVCPGDSVQISITAQNGAAPITYQWIPTTGMANPNSATTMLLPPASGMYYCLVTDACGSSGLDSLYVTINTPPTVSASVTTDSVCTGGSFTATGSGAVTYAWTGGVTDGVPFMPSVTDNYTVTGTDANGCTNIAIATVVVMPLPTISASVTDSTVCSGDSVIFSGSGASTYAWDNGVTDGVPYTPTGTANYTVIGTDIYGCMDTTSIAVTVNANPDVITTTAGSPYCDGSGSANLSATGADTYVWMPGPQTGSSITVNPSVTTTYTVTGTDTITGCVDTVSMQVVVNPNPVLTVNSDSVCSGNSSNLVANATNGTPAYAYQWSPSTGLSNPNIPNPVATNTLTMCYTVTVTDANGCMDMTTSCQVVNQPPVVAASGSDLTPCADDANVILTGTPSGGTFTGTSVTSSQFDPSIGAGTYQVVYSVTDTNGCSAADTITIAVDACVGITDNNANDGVNVFPNPFGTQLFVNLDQVSHVRMFNNLGQVVFEQELNAGRNEISTAEFPSGIYTMEVVNGNGTAVIKIVRSAQ